MNISVFGLGYVGAVSAGCLARDGHRVIGVDPNRTKVDLINAGLSPIVEKDIDRIIADAVAARLLEATDDCGSAVADTMLSLICVGTPSQANGSLDLGHVDAVCAEIGTALRDKQTFHVVVVRSTMLPGSVRGIVIDGLERSSGKRAGVDFGVCINPEFLREGSAVFDYDHPPKTVIGESDTAAGDLLLQLYAHLDAPLIRTDVETAEMVKYSDNAWHALKVGFANEIGNFCKASGIDGSRVMEIFCRDTKLNLSPYYMKPGFAFGGSCLPKDLRALTHRARGMDLELPILNAILPSNERQIRNGIRMIVGKRHRRVGFLGFSFKAGTDDLRESPLVDVIEYLLGKGYDLRLYDRNVSLARLTGANQDYILNLIPHVSRLMVESMDELLDFAGTVVIGNAAPEFNTVPQRLRPGQVIVDLVRIGGEAAGPAYDGICW
ncbi:MAG: UDP-glucose/GDP-mannose dehydrogenase family protein [Herminiimonas sp.]|nr:UDP-glucose/GDP-mannose dehydrogenase family protein [Herminiimonas sp.]